MTILRQLEKEKQEYIKAQLDRLLRINQEQIELTKILLKKLRWRKQFLEDIKRNRRTLEQLLRFIGGKSLSMSLFLITFSLRLCLSSHKKVNYRVSVGKLTYTIDRKHDHIIKLPRRALTYQFPVCDVCNSELKGLHVKVLILSLHPWGCVCDNCIERYHAKLPIYLLNACPKCLSKLEPLKPLDSPEPDFHVCKRCGLAIGSKLHGVLARVV